MNLRTTNYLIFALLTLLTSCGGETVKSSSALDDEELDSMTIAFNEKLKSDTIEGDFDGDGEREKAWVVAPKVIDWENQECEGPIVTYVCFSDSSLKTIEANGIVGGRVQNLGDLNDDGYDELGFYGGWFLSTMHGYDVYGMNKNREWRKLIETQLLRDVWAEELGFSPEFKPIVKKDKHSVYVYVFEYGTATRIKVVPMITTHF